MSMSGHPRGPFANSAYQLLEEHLLVGYGGSSELHLPPEQEARLLALRDLLHRAQTEVD